MSQINFFAIDVKSPRINKVKLKRFLADIFMKHEKELSSLNFIFCSDNYLLKINQEFLKHEYYTDIITFNYNDSVVEGEVYISVERIKENAITLEENENRELHRVIFHGVLHLCGFDDSTRILKNKMRKLEDECLIAYFVSRETK